jgi:alpha-tubulin suppressor-like RCC1 family protein
MRWLQQVRVVGCVATALFVGGCADDDPATAPDLVPAAKQAPALKVTPSQLNLAGVGVTATLSASSSSAGLVTATVSIPACVSLASKGHQQNQRKFTVMAVVAGSCSITVGDGVSTVEVPVRVASSVVRTTLAAGIFHTCGIDASGAAWCWGFNGYGQLGNTGGLGSAFANPTPQQVSGGLTFAALTGGSNHSCGLTPAGKVYCWGRNDFGQLGSAATSGTTGPNSTPIAVDGNLTFTSIEAGAEHTCGLSAGVIYCWGKNNLGQLGTTTSNGTPTPHPTPTPINSTLTFVAVAAGTDHTCGVTGGGAVYCWGDNSFGQLGNSENVGEELTAHSTPTAVSGLPGLASLALGGHYSCGLTSAGAAWCWGDNNFGELGTTTADTRVSTPVAVDGALSFVSLGAGGGHTCGLVSGGTLYCWGGNLLGQLGSGTNVGTTTPNPAPTAVAGLTLATVAVKAAHTCGLTAAGVASCWGFNRYGQLGTTDNNDSDNPNPSPTAVTGGLTFAVQ